MYHLAVIHVEKVISRLVKRKIKLFLDPNV
jgi:hypothetical protein